MKAKYQLLAENLRAELQRWGSPGMKLPTEQDIALRYQMSRQTVRHALRLLVEEGLIRSRQGSGYYIADPADSSPRQIAILISSQDEYIFPTVIRDAKAVFTQQGYAVTVFQTRNRVSREKEILEALLEQGVTGILAEGVKTALPTPNEGLYRALRRSGTQILFFHGVCPNLQDIPCMSDDNFSGGYQLARYLIGQGHRDVGGIFKSDDMQGLQRYHGMAAALHDAGIPIRDDAVCWYDTWDRESMLQGQPPQEALLQRLQGVTAVVCYNDEVANLLIRRLLAEGRQVPRDLAVVSFDNSFISQVCPVEITSLARKGVRMGQFAAQQLLQLLSGAQVRSAALGWTLIERKSG